MFLGHNCSMPTVPWGGDFGSEISCGTERNTYLTSSGKCATYIAPLATELLEGKRHDIPSKECGGTLLNTRGPYLNPQPSPILAPGTKCYGRFGLNALPKARRGHPTREQPLDPFTSPYIRRPV